MDFFHSRCMEFSILHQCLLLFDQFWLTSFRTEFQIFLQHHIAIFVIGQKMTFLLAFLSWEHSSEKDVFAQLNPLEECFKICHMLCVYKKLNYKGKGMYCIIAHLGPTQACRLLISSIFLCNEFPTFFGNSGT